MEVLFEFLFDLYLELMIFIIPEEKTTSKRYKVVVTVFAVCVLVLVLALVFWGLVLILDKSSSLGYIPLGAAIGISVLQIVFGLVVQIKNH